jgi:hypothetical protein
LKVHPSGFWGTWTSRAPGHSAAQRACRTRSVPARSHCRCAAELDTVEFGTVAAGKPIRIDGQLDEAVYREIPRITDFIQRYGPGREPTWGIQVRRLIRSKNERVHLTRLSAAWAQGAWNRMAIAATLIGL